MTFTIDDVKRVVWTFIFAFLVALGAGLSGLEQLPTLDAGKAMVFAAILAGLQAAGSFVKNLLLPDGHVLK